MLAADGAVCVVQNGEILNHLELRAALERDGVRFRTRSDTEVLLHLYLRDGPEFVSQLRGMFALALWDRRERRLVLARDRYGIKPLYYELANGRLTFASELKALLRQPSFSRDLDIEALHSFLAFNSIPGTADDLPRGAQAAGRPPAVCGPSGVRLHRYARPAPAAGSELRRESAEVLAEELRERLSESVKAHLLADVPVGVLLSGGVDSSVLTALASQASPQRVSDVFDRLQGAVSSTNSTLPGRWRGATAPIITSWSCRRDLRAVAEVGRVLRRTVRGFVRGADLPCL